MHNYSGKIMLFWGEKNANVLISQFANVPMGGLSYCAIFKLNN